MNGSASLSTLVNTALLIVLGGFLLVVGKPVLLPILAAIIVVYVLVDASEAMQRVPVIGRLPPPVGGARLSCWASTSVCSR